MKKLLPIIAVVSVLALLFVMKNRPTGGDAEGSAEIEVVDHEARQDTVDFWRHYRAAMKARRLGNWDEAIEGFGRALALQPEHEDSLYYLGNAYFESGAYDQAVASWTRLIAVNPMSARAFVQLGQVRSCPDIEDMFDLEAALAAMKAGFDLNPEQSGPLSRLGEVELAIGEWERAEELFDDARRSNPRATSAHYLGAYLAMKAGDRAQAELLFDEAREAASVSRVTAVPVLEGDMRPGDEEGRVDETMSSRRLFAPLLARLEGDDPIDPEAEVLAVDAYIASLPRTR